MSADPYPPAGPSQSPGALEPQAPKALLGSPYPKADLLPRLLARIFDLMVCGALVALMHRAGAAAGALYLLFADGLFRGQSLGKRILGIKVLHLPTLRGAGARQSAIRNFPLAVLGLLAMGPVEHWKLLAAFSLAVLGYESLRALFDPLGLRIGDALAHTQVIDGKVVAGAPALVGPTPRPQRVEHVPRRSGGQPEWLDGPRAFGP